MAKLRSFGLVYAGQDFCLRPAGSLTALKYSEDKLLGKYDR